MVDERGRERARYVMLRLLERAREKQVGVPALRSTDYINTIPPEREPWFPGDEEMERQVRRLIRWNAAVMVSSANRKGLEVGGHIASYASAASLYEVGYNHFFRGKDHPGGGDQLYIQGHAAPGIYARAYLMKRLTAEQLGRFRQEVQHGPGQGLSSYPHPAPDAGLLGVPDGLHGPRRPQRDLPGTVQPLPPQPRHQGHQQPARLGVPRRRRDGRARVARCHSRGRARRARQPHVRDQLQLAAARRPGDGQRQDHAGARGQLPRRRLERHQGRLGPRVGRPARQGRRRRARQPDEPHPRRPVPDLLRRERRLHPRALLRRRQQTAQDGRAPQRRGDRATAPWRPRLPQGVRRVPGRRQPRRPADGDPRPHGEGLDHRGARGQERHPPDEEAQRRQPQGVPRPPRAAGHRQGDRRRLRRRRLRAVLPPGRGQRRARLPARAPARAGRPRAAAPCPADRDHLARQGDVRRAARRLRQAGHRDHDGVRPPAQGPDEGPLDRQADRADRARRVPHVRHGLDVLDGQDLQPGRARPTSPSTASC